MGMAIMAATVRGMTHQNYSTYLVLHVHALQDGGAVVGHRDVAVRPHDHLVHALRAQAGAHGLGHGLGRDDVLLVRLDALHTLLAALLLNHTERVAVLVDLGCSGRSCSCRCNHITTYPYELPHSSRVGVV